MPALELDMFCGRKFVGIIAASLAYELMISKGRVGSLAPPPRMDTRISLLGTSIRNKISAAVKAWSRGGLNDRWLP